VIDSRLRYGGQGRFLQAHVSENFPYILKTYYDPQKRKTVLIDWIENGYTIAKTHLQGLAAPTFVIDATEGGKKEASYSTEGRRQKTDIAIIQTRITPFLDHLKTLTRTKRTNEAKQLIDKFKEYVILMYRRGVVDNDIGGTLANYGVEEKTGKVYVFDFGDFSVNFADAEAYVSFIDTSMNRFTEDGLTSEVGKELGEYYRKNPLKQSDFTGKDGEDLFGVDLKRLTPEKLKMTFPLKEGEIRKLFAPATEARSRDTDNRNEDGSSGRFSKF
ncbi:hypothetical protein ACFLZ2_06185, partial [Candidatus Margulisiibacteriota bacterium]